MQFTRNLMYQFNLKSEQYLTCDISNCILLRQDLLAPFNQVVRTNAEERNVGSALLDKGSRLLQDVPRACYYHAKGSPRLLVHAL